MAIRLKWIDNSQGEASQNIYRAEAPIDVNSLPVPLAILAAEIEEYLDTTVESGKTYYYRISSIGNNTEKVSSEKVITASVDGSTGVLNIVLDPVNSEGTVTDYTLTNTSGNWDSAVTDLTFNSGFLYYEVTLDTYIDSNGIYVGTTVDPVTLGEPAGNVIAEIAYHGNSNRVYENNIIIGNTGIGGNVAQSDVVGVLIDVDSAFLAGFTPSGVYNAGGFSNSAAKRNDDHYALISVPNGTVASVNFGQNPFTNTLPNGAKSVDGSIVNTDESFFEGYKGSGVTLSNNNLTVNSTSFRSAFGRLRHESGIKYMEMFIDSIAGSAFVGICRIDAIENSLSNQMGYINGFENIAYRHDGNVYKNSAAILATGVTYTTGDTIGILLDMDNLTLRFIDKNGVPTSAIPISAGKYLAGCSPVSATISMIPESPFTHSPPDTPDDWTVVDPPLPPPAPIGLTVTKESTWHRIYIIRTQSANPPGGSISGPRWVEELFFYSDAAGTVRENTGTVFGGVPLASPSWDAVNAFDGNTTSSGHQTNTAPTSLGRGLSSAAEIVRVDMMAVRASALGNQSKSPNQFIIQKSIDRINWVDTFYQNTSPNWTVGETRQYDIAVNPTINLFKSYRLKIDGVTSGNVAAIKELILNTVHGRRVSGSGFSWAGTPLASSGTAINAFGEDVNASIWASSNVPGPHYLGILDLENTHTVLDDYEVHVNAIGNDNPITWTLQGSNDNTTILDGIWENIDTITGHSWTGTTFQKTLTLDPGT